MLTCWKEKYKNNVDYAESLNIIQDDEDTLDGKETVEVQLNQQTMTEPNLNVLLVVSRFEIHRSSSELWTWNFKRTKMTKNS